MVVASTLGKVSILIMVGMDEYLFALKSDILLSLFLLLEICGSSGWNSVKSSYMPIKVFKMYGLIIP